MKYKYQLFSISLFMLMLFVGCSSENGAAIDVLKPKVLIQSPVVIFDYSTDIGNSYVSHTVTLQAQGSDETNVSAFNLLVTNENGVVVLEKKGLIKDVSTKIVTISEKFNTTVIGNYTAVFTAIDGSGNTAVGTINFTYSDL